MKKFLKYFFHNLIFNGLIPIVIIVVAALIIIYITIEIFGVPIV